MKISRKHLDELEGIADADNLEFYRMMESNERLRTGLRELRARFGLPAGLDDLEHWYESHRDIAIRVGQEVAHMLDEHGLDDKWRIPLLQLAILGYEFPHFVPHYPEIRVRYDKKGRPIDEIVITPTTPIDNPAVLNYIKRWQEMARDVPPQPQPLLGNPRKLDWRPVKEWSMRHPDVSNKEIARMIGCTHQRVRLKLAELSSKE